MSVTHTDRGGCLGQCLVLKFISVKHKHPVSWDASPAVCVTTLAKGTGCFVMYQPDMFDNSDARLQERFINNKGRLKRHAGKELVPMGISWCSRCRKFLPIDNFPRRSAEATGVSRYCLACSRRVQNTQARKRSPALRSARTDNKAELVKLLGGRCVRCGYREFLAGLDFHHVAPQTKSFNISKIMSTRTRNTIDYDALIKEIDKCALLCSNCHKSISFWSEGVEWHKSIMGWDIKPSGEED